jgi:hypothetical protein
MDERTIPVVHYDNVLTGNEIEYLIYLFDKQEEWKDPIDAGAALVNGEPQKQAKTVIFNRDWNSENCYPFLSNKITNIISEVFLEAMAGSSHWVWKYLGNCNTGTVLGAKYKKGDFYKVHTDSCKISAVYTFAKNPDKVQGGGFMFEESTIQDFTHNRLTIFPSIIRHEVLEILGEEERLSITLLLETNTSLEEEKRRQLYENYLAEQDNRLSEMEGKENN